MPKKLTQEEVINRFKEKHSDKYDYSLVEYKGVDNMVKIICSIHYVFEQSPYLHMQGRNCPRCANLEQWKKRKPTTSDFIKKANRKHGNKYDYSLVEYIDAKTKVKIKCKDHGVFEQTPNDHINGKGCYHCGRKIVEAGNRLTQDEIISKFKEIHGDKYDYRFVKYKNSSTKVEIICDKGHLFEQTPYSHLNRSGCPYCVGRNKTTEDIVNEFINIHGNKYDYSLVEYKRYDSKVKIICIEHGIFEQTPNKHISNQGCPKCGREKTNRHQRKTPLGWSISSWERKAKISNHFDSFKVYVIKCHNETEAFYKIGRTFSKIKRRFPSKLSMPYSYEIVKEITFNNAIDCFNKENELKRLHKEYKYLPKIKFNGRHECFSKIDDSILV